MRWLVDIVVSASDSRTRDQAVCILAGPVLGGIVVLGGTTRRQRRQSLRPEGPKIEAEGRGRGGVLGEGVASPLLTS